MSCMGVVRALQLKGFMTSEPNGPIFTVIDLYMDKLCLCEAVCTGVICITIDGMWTQMMRQCFWIL